MATFVLANHSMYCFNLHNNLNKEGNQKFGNRVRAKDRLNKEEYEFDPSFCSALKFDKDYGLVGCWL